MSNNVFFSWSGSISNAIATVFNTYLPKIIQETNVFFSKEGIPKDRAWFQEIDEAILNVKTGIVFLADGNFKKEWILFESGAIAAKGSICVLSYDISIQDLKREESIFRYYSVTDLNRDEDLLRMFNSIRKRIGANVSKKVMEETFFLYREAFRRELDTFIEGAKKQTISPNLFSDIAGTYYLNIVNKDGIPYREKLRIDEDGKYFIQQGHNEIYYFQLRVLKRVDNSITWQKLSVSEGKPSDSVHSTEQLVLNDAGLAGKDTFDHKLGYLSEIK